MNNIDDIEYLVKGMPKENDAFTNSTAGASMLKLEPAQGLYGINNADYSYPLQFNHHQDHSSMKVEPVMNDDNTRNIYTHRDRNQDNSQANTGRNLLPILNFEPVQNLPDLGNEKSNHPMARSDKCVQNTGNKQKVTQDADTESRDLLQTLKAEVIQNLPDVDEGNNQCKGDGPVKNNQSEARDISISTISGSSEEQHKPHNNLSEVHQNRNSWIFHRFTESSSLGSDKHVNPLERQNETLCSSQDEIFAARIGGSKASITKLVESNHIGNARQHWLRYCTVSLTRIEEQISKGSCILNNDMITYSGPSCIRIRPVQCRESEPVQSRELTTVLGCQTVGDCNMIDEKDNVQVMIKKKCGRKIKMFRTNYVEENNESEDEVEDDMLSEDKIGADNLETEEIEVDGSARKYCLKLLRAQETKEARTETYLKKKSFVDSETLNKYMEWNADLICLVCQKAMTSLTEWNNHYYNWTKCSSFFVDERNRCLTCPPCKTSFKYFTKWSRHMFMEGPHGDMGFNTFPRGFIKSFQKSLDMMLQEGCENEQMTNLDQHIDTTEIRVDQIKNSWLLKQPRSEQEVNTLSQELNKQCFRFCAGFICKICKNKTVYRYETRAIIHVYDVHITVGKSNYRCSTCNQYFKMEHIRRMHNVECHQGKPTKRDRELKKCHICGKIVKNLQSHLAVHNVSKHVSCVVCGNRIKETFMGTHLKRCHSGISYKKKRKKQICEVCGKTLSASGIGPHLKTHLKNRKRVNCFVCKSSILADSLASHMFLHSSGCQCEFCGKRCFSKYSLAYHIQRVHLKTITKKTCEVCSASVYNMDIHMKSHQRKQFACSICGKEFRLKHHLNTHVNGVHKNIRPFHCAVCDYKFTLKHHLTAHMNSIHNKMEATGTAKTTKRKKLNGQNTSNCHTKKKKGKVKNMKDINPKTKGKK